MRPSRCHRAQISAVFCRSLIYCIYIVYILCIYIYICTRIHFMSSCSFCLYLQSRSLVSFGLDTLIIGRSVGPHALQCLMNVYYNLNVVLLLFFPFCFLLFFFALIFFVASFISLASAQFRNVSQDISQYHTAKLIYN